MIFMKMNVQSNWVFYFVYRYDIFSKKSLLQKLFTLKVVYSLFNIKKNKNFIFSY